MLGIDENKIAKSIVEKVNAELATKWVAEFEKIQKEFVRMASYINILEQRIAKLEKK